MSQSVRENNELAERFWRDWDKHHANRQPIGWALWPLNEIPWVRFHGLPASKRYAENELERQTILMRGNRIGDELFGIGCNCWAVATCCDAKFDQGTLVGRWIEEPEDPESVAWHFSVREEIWLAGEHDSQLTEIAGDGPYHLLWFQPQTGEIFAPYDGGFDVFPKSLGEETRLRQRFSKWLSSHPSGL